MTTTDSSRPPPVPITLSSPAFFLSAEQNPFPLFRPPFLNHPATYRMKGSGGKWKRGESFGSRNIAHSRAMWLDLSPSSLPPMVLADPGFACQKPKIPPLGIWCPRSEKLGIIKPYSSHVPLSVLHNPQADKWYGGQTQLSWTYAWGKLEMGQGCPAMGNPKPNI